MVWILSLVDLVCGVLFMVWILSLVDLVCGV